MHQSQIESGQEDKALRRQITLHVFYVACFPSISVTVNIYVFSAQVRIFPYLIGRESAFADNLKWMACANKGWRLFDKHFSRELCDWVWNTVWCAVSVEWCDWLGWGCVGIHVVWPCLCMLLVFSCVHASVYVLAQTLSAKRQWSGTWGGQRSIRSNPSSCQSVSPLAARCWWLPRVSALDECPLEGEVAARKTDHRRTVGGGTIPEHPSPCRPPLWNNLACPKWSIVSNSRSWHKVKWLACRSKLNQWNTLPGRFQYSPVMSGPSAGVESN